MSDYLTSLIERSLDLTPQIKPLIASIHAPSDLTLNETAESLAWATIPRVNPQVEIETSFESKIDPSAPDASPEIALKVKPPVSETVRSSPSPDISPAVTAVADNESSRASDLSPKGEAELPVDTNDVPHPPIAVSADASAASHSKSMEIPSVSQRPLRSAPKPVLPNEKMQLVVKPEIVGRLKPEPRLPAAVVNSPPARDSTVHISIGRVEVRAVVPHSVPPKPFPPSLPKLSLEDYLKNRSRGSV